MVVAVQVVGHRMYPHGQGSTQVGTGPHRDHQVDQSEDFAAPQHTVGHARGTGALDGMAKKEVHLDFPCTLSNHQRSAVDQMAGPIAGFGMRAKTGEDID